MILICNKKNILYMASIGESGGSSSMHEIVQIQEEKVDLRSDSADRVMVVGVRWTKLLISRESLSLWSQVPLMVSSSCRWASRAVNLGLAHPIKCYLFFFLAKWKKSSDWVDSLQPMDDDLSAAAPPKAP